MSQIRVPPIYGEDYEFQWGKIDYKNKFVLDIGGSNGDTADFFLRKGARVVIVVDSNPELIKQCFENSIKFSLPIIPILLNMTIITNWLNLIDILKPEVVKSDCEGCERELFNMPKEIFRIPLEYIIEVHGEDISELFKKKCEECNYEIKDINPWAWSVKIVYAKRRD